MLADVVPHWAGPWAKTQHSKSCLGGNCARPITYPHIFNCLNPFIKISPHFVPCSRLVMEVKIYLDDLFLFFFCYLGWKTGLCNFRHWSRLRVVTTGCGGAVAILWLILHQLPAGFSHLWQRAHVTWVFHVTVAGHVTRTGHVTTLWLFVCH